MGWLTAAFSGVKTLFGGSSSSGMDVIKGVGGWIDEQKFTEQEKAVDSMERAKLYGMFFSQTVSENSERSRTRRALALLIIRWWLFMLTASAALYPVNQPWAEYIFKIATATAVGILVAGVGAFFFGTHLLRERSAAK